MAFLPTSRYAQLPTVEVPSGDDRTATIVKLRRLPATEGEPTVMAEHDRLDVIARERYGESTEYWHIADANSELVASDLVQVGRVIRVPAK
ncbi:MAG: LysM domain-containing protein [Kofleriaceae bacterium]